MWTSGASSHSHESVKAQRARPSSRSPSPWSGKTAEATATAWTSSSVSASSWRRTSGAKSQSTNVMWSARTCMPMTVFIKGWPWAINQYVW